MMMVGGQVATARVGVLVVEPHEICRRAVRALADGETLAIVGEAGSTDALDETNIEGTPDVVLLGFENSEGTSMIDRLRARFPEARILVLAEISDGESAFRSVRAGADGLVPKSAAPDEIRDAINAIARGEQVFHPELSAEALLWAARNEGLKTSNPKNPPPLTPREREILEHLSEGLSAADIAARLHLSRRTVEAHLANAYRKLGVHGRIEALREYQKVADVLQPTTKH